MSLRTDPEIVSILSLINDYIAINDGSHTAKINLFTHVIPNLISISHRYDVYRLVGGSYR